MNHEGRACLCIKFKVVLATHHLIIYLVDSCFSITPLRNLNKLPYSRKPRLQLNLSQLRSI